MPQTPPPPDAPRPGADGSTPGVADLPAGADRPTSGADGLTSGADLPPGADGPLGNPGSLLLAGDIGGTHARLRLMLPDGTVLATAEGEGWNVNSSGSSSPVHLTRLAADVLAGHSPDRVRLALCGIAGAGPARHDEVLASIRAALEPAGIAPSAVTVVEDLHTAFAAGFASETAGAQGQLDPGTGILLLAGTGSLAARFDDFTLRQRIDGMGWLLGDLGSAVWLGRRALEAAAADLDQRGPATTLTSAVLSHLGVAPDSPGDIRQHLIAAAYALPPAHWGRLARVVTASDADDDAVALALRDEAIHLLLGYVARLTRGAEPPAHGGDSAAAGTAPSASTRESPLPVVLAGALLTEDTPIARGVRRGLEADGHPLLTASTTIDGAALLAQRSSCAVQAAS